MIRFTPTTGAATQFAGDNLDGTCGTLLEDAPLVSVSANIQESFPFRADKAVRFARGGARASITFSVWRKHSSLGEAIQFAHTQQRDLINSLGTLTYTDSGRTITYLNAVITGIQPVSRTGISTIIQYTLASDPAS